MRIRCRSQWKNQKSIYHFFEAWLESYHAEELFDERGSLDPRARRTCSKGSARLGANPHANGGLLLKDLRLPDFRTYGIEVDPGKTKAQDMIELGGYIRDIFVLNKENQNFRIFRTGREYVQPFIQSI